MAELTYYYFGSRNLRLTSPPLQGTDVKVLQSLLNILPDNIVPGKLLEDGVFGPITRTAVRNFQNYFGLVRDGIVGPETYRSLGQRTGKYAAGEAVFSSRTLKRGSIGKDVTVLQNRLAAYKKPYLNRKADGRFGFFTDTAVQLFQAEFPDVPIDGIAGPDTYNRIFIYAPLGGRTLRLNDRGLDVYWLQYYLYQLNYYRGEVNGYFQSATSDAVKAFQKAAGITADGIVGAETYLSLGTSIPFPQQQYYYRVQTGDSVYTIARMFRKKAEDIIKRNGLNPPDYLIKTGQLLLIPPPLNFHLAEIGETLTDVAAKYSLSLPNLQAANNLIPEGFLIPDEAVVLPGYEASLPGEIAFLQSADVADDLIKLNPANGTTTRLDRFTNLSQQVLYLSKNRKEIALLAEGGRRIIIHDLTKGTSRTINLPQSTDYLDWSYDGSMLALNNGRVISAADGKTLFSFIGKMPQWFTDNESLLYSNGISSLRKVNIETGEDQLVLELTDYAVWFFQLAAPVNKLLVMGFADPGRVTFTFLYDLTTKQLTEVSRDDFFAEWSRDFSSFQLLRRDYYGEFPSWFYLQVNRYMNDGLFTEQALYAKEVSLNNDNFSPSDRAFLLTLGNPVTFYPLPVIYRDIYAKTLDSRLLTQLTLAKKSYSPVWL